MKTGIIKKPWGYEYLAYANPGVAVWVLRMLTGHSTSLHAHPHKCTAFVVLKGKLSLHLLRGAPIDLGPLDKINVFRGRFHSLRARSPLTLLEIESPNNKRDIIRLSDRYGRVGQQIEAPSSPLTSDCIQLSRQPVAYAGRLLEILKYPVDYLPEGEPTDVYVTLQGGLANGALLPPGEAIDANSFAQLRKVFPIKRGSMFLRVTR